MGGIVSSLIKGSKKAKTPPYKDLAQANLEAGDIINQATLDNIDDFTRFIALSDERLAPWIEAGHSALADIQGGLASGEFDAGEFVVPKMSDLHADPGYQFRMSEGLKAIRRQMAAGGLGQSGAHTKAAIGYAGDLADQEYDTIYNRALDRHKLKQKQRQTRLANLAGVADVGFDALDTGLDNRWKGTYATAGQRLTGAEARGNAKLGYWNALIDRRNFKNQASAERRGHLADAAGDTVNLAAGFLI